MNCRVLTQIFRGVGSVAKQISENIWQGGIILLLFLGGGFAVLTIVVSAALLLAYLLTYHPIIMFAVVLPALAWAIGYTDNKGAKQ